MPMRLRGIFVHLLPSNPIFTYGAETWNTTKHLARQLRTMQRAHERIMLNLTLKDRKTAIWIREKTKIKDVNVTVQQLKWNWAGHVMRRSDNRWSKKTTDWTPRGYTRNRGRQRVRWRDDIDSYMCCVNWQGVAQSRGRWKALGKAFGLPNSGLLG